MGLIKLTDVDLPNLGECDSLSTHYSECDPLSTHYSECDSLSTHYSECDTPIPACVYVTAGS